MKPNPVYVVDLIGEVVKRVDAALPYRVNYMYGHWDEVRGKILQIKDTDKKYPMIVLLQDFDEQHDGKEAGFEVSLRLIIITSTKPTDYAPDRYTSNFKKVLYPVWLEFMEQLALSGYFMESTSTQLTYKKTDRLYWGKSNLDGNTANKGYDHIDGIELENLTLNVLPINC